MKTQTKAIVASTLLTALFAAQPALADGDIDRSPAPQYSSADLSDAKVNYVISAELVVSGRK